MTNLANVTSGRSILTNSQEVIMKRGVFILVPGFAAAAAGYVHLPNLHVLRAEFRAG